jgi:hypothetical protein
MRILRFRIPNSRGSTDYDLDRRGEEGDALLQPVGQGVLQQVPKAEDHTSSIAKVSTAQQRSGCRTIYYGSGYSKFFYGSGYEHFVTDPGTEHFVTNPGTEHFCTDPGTEHFVTFPGTEHFVTDPGTKHFVTDPGTRFEKCSSSNMICGSFPVINPPVLLSLSVLILSKRAEAINSPEPTI